ncbi:MAG: CatB-related O-acetyltransferase [Rickettsiales bacterium]|nr:MAG: CatB-related O-acetyltransferase [Rickettsiales bacterium]
MFLTNIFKKIYYKIFSISTVVNKVSLFTNKIPKYEKFEIGEGTYGEPEIFDWNDGSTLKIGKYCSLGRVSILLGGEHNLTGPSTYPFESINLKADSLDTSKVSDRHSKGDVIIGNDVWIGDKTTILSGIVIGTGAVIGACTVVSKNIPPYAVVVGNPCRIIKYRFSEKEIEDMLQIKWWEWNDIKIKKNMDDFNLPLQQFIKKYLPIICSNE